MGFFNEVPFIEYAVFARNDDGVGKRADSGADDGCDEGLE